MNLDDMTVEQRAEFDLAYAQESLIWSVTEEVCRVMNEAGVSRTELAQRAGTSVSHISQLLDGTRNMTLRTAATLAHALGQQVAIELRRDPAWVVAEDGGTAAAL